MLTEQLEHTERMQEITVTEKDIKEKLRTAPTFKSPGIDKIQNYWLKQLNNLHKYYAISFQKILNNEEPIPKWLTQGTTYLLPKTAETDQPKKYRPITCLPTTYKLLTGVIADRIYNHLEHQQLIFNQKSKKL